MGSPEFATANVHIEPIQLSYLAIRSRSFNWDDMDFSFLELILFLFFEVLVYLAVSTNSLINFVEISEANCQPTNPESVFVDKINREKTFP